MRFLAAVLVFCCLPWNALAHEGVDCKPLDLKGLNDPITFISLDVAIVKIRERGSTPDSYYAIRFRSKDEVKKEPGVEAVLIGTKASEKDMYVSHLDKTHKLLFEYGEGGSWIIKIDGPVRRSYSCPEK